jgi:hypothetical protein
MDKYIITYEYKIKKGYLASIICETNILSFNEMNKLVKTHTEMNDSMKVLYCAKLGEINDEEV